MSLLIGAAVGGKAIAGTKAAVVANVGLLKMAALTSILADILTTGAYITIACCVVDVENVSPQGSTDVSKIKLQPDP